MTGTTPAVIAAEVESRADWGRLVASALEEDRITALYQPIIDVGRRSVVGYEALSRFEHPDAPSVGPDRWFAEAAEMGVGAELEARALRAALAHRETMPRNCFLTVNMDPMYLTEPAIRDVLASQSSLRGLVVEFTEHREWDWRLIESSVQMLRSSGAIIAIDDAGSGYSGLQQILQLRPSILKLDRSLVESIDIDEAKASLVEMIGVFAGRIDAWILAEGIETRAEARRLVDLGVPLAQGYFFGRPAPPWTPIDVSAVSVLQDEVESGETLHRLVDPAAPVRAGDEMIGDWLDAADPWRTIIDADRRPLGMVDADALMTGSIVPALIANVSSSPHEVAQRLSTFAGDPHVPVVVTDDTGRYLGIVGLRRLLNRVGRVD